MLHYLILTIIMGIGINSILQSKDQKVIFFWVMQLVVRSNTLKQLI